LKTNKNKVVAVALSKKLETLRKRKFLLKIKHRMREAELALLTVDKELTRDLLQIFFPEHMSDIFNKLSVVGKLNYIQSIFDRTLNLINNRKITFGYTLTGRVEQQTLGFYIGELAIFKKVLNGELQTVNFGWHHIHGGSFLHYELIGNEIYRSYSSVNHPDKVLKERYVIGVTLSRSDEFWEHPITHKKATLSSFNGFLNKVAIK
jgi:hypothetical protein